MSVTQGLRRAVQINGGGAATLCGEREHTWAEFAKRVARIAGALRALGGCDGERVAIVALNSDRYLEYYYAVPWAGGIVVPVNIRLGAPEILQVLDDSGASVLVVDDAFAPLLPAIRKNSRTVRQVLFAGDGETPPETVAWEDAARSDPVDDAVGGWDDVYGLFYTGGTTGRAKGVMLTHGNIVSNAINVTPPARWDEATCYLHAAPMFHLADCAATFAVTMCAGRHAFVPKFAPAATVAAIGRFGVTHALLVPTMIGMMIGDPAVQSSDLSTLNTILYGASPMPEAVMRRALETFPGCDFMQAYGMTELSPVATVLDRRYHTFEGPDAGRLRSAGRATFTVDVRVVDEHGVEVPRGTIGEIAVRGPIVMKGYYNQPELTAGTIRDGWMHTGDAARMDEDGFVYIVDRLKDMVVSGGENVYSAEVENAVHQHPGVAMCAVIGIPHDELVEAVHAIVVPKEGQTLEPAEIIAHCHERIAGYKCPRSVEVRSEPLPLSGAGKILKKDLRAPHWKGHDTGVA